MSNDLDCDVSQASDVVIVREVADIHRVGFEDQYITIVGLRRTSQVLTKATSMLAELCCQQKYY